MNQIELKLPSRSLICLYACSEPERFSNRKSPDLPATTISKSPSPPISTTGNLQSAAGSRAVVDDVPPPLDAFRSLRKLIPVDTQRLIRTWVMLMRFVAFSRDQLRFTIAV